MTTVLKYRLQNFRNSPLGKRWLAHFATYIARMHQVSNACPSKTNVPNRDVSVEIALETRQTQNSVKETSDVARNCKKKGNESDEKELKTPLVSGHNDKTKSY